jgi:hypothetical protein
MRTAEGPLWFSAAPWGLAVTGAVSSAIFLILLLSVGHVDGVPYIVPIVLMGLVVLARLAPGPALIVLAATIPVATWTGRSWNGSVAWPEVLAVAFCAGYLGRTAWTRQARTDPLHVPIVAFTTLVLASLAVRLLVLDWTIGGVAMRQQLLELTRGGYFVGSVFRELDAAMRLVEGMVLLRAASSAAECNPSFAPRLTRSFVVGAAAAASLNIWRLWESAVRAESPVAQLFEYLITVRYNAHYGDVNAAGSYYVLALLVACGLVLRTRHIQWVLAPVLIATSLMLSGSRAALVAGAVSAFAWSAWRVKNSLAGRKSPALIFISLLLVTCAAGGIYYVSARRNWTPSSSAFQVRAGFARTTINMVAAHPAFGIGIGQYPMQSNTYSPPHFAESLGGLNQNAHNNFFQVLGELGILGLSAFLWVLWRSGRQLFDAVKTAPDPLRDGVAAGLLAFVLSWLSGHPLLIDEPALMFWLLAGTAAGWTSHESVRRPGAMGRRAMLAISAVAVLVSVPLRAHHELANMELDHQGIGLSGWRVAPDGVRYRLGGTSTTVFVPSAAQAVTIPLRSAEPGAERLVRILLDGKPANVVRVSGDRWYQLDLVLAGRRFESRYVGLEFRIEGEDRRDPESLMIGKVERR